MSARAAGAVERARTATYVAFIGVGAASASWAARIPQVRDHLRLTSSGLGLLLLSIAVGSVLALPVSGHLTSRFGSRRVVTVSSWLLACGLLIIAGGYRFGVAPVVAGLFLFGFCAATWDVAMNVQGARVERLLGRSIMSRFHAGFSLGTVAGALAGAAVVALGVPVAPHLAVTALIVTCCVSLSARAMLPDDEQDDDGAGGVGGGAGHGHRVDAGGRDGTAAGEPVRGAGVGAAWRSPRTLLIGLFVLAFAFAEGTGNDWIGIGLIDGYRRPATTGTLAFAAFLAAMTAGRWFGTTLLDRFGRVTVTRCAAVLATVGVLLFAVGPTPAVAFAGTLLWGLGTSVGFPVGMSAGADDPRRAAANVSVIASIGYCAFLGGPPLIGFLSHAYGVRHAVTAVAALLAVAALIASVLTPPRTAPVVPAPVVPAPAHRSGADADADADAERSGTEAL